MTALVEVEPEVPLTCLPGILSIVVEPWTSQGLVGHWEVYRGCCLPSEDIIVKLESSCSTLRLPAWR